jgi:hypothetical protein
MSKATHWSASTPISTISNKPDQRVVPIRSGKSDAKKNTWHFDLEKLIPISLFSGIGLLSSLIVILFGVQGGWS